MDEKITVSELEDTFIEDLNSLDDWFLQYEYLLAIAADMPNIEEKDRTLERKVPGCQSGVWIMMDYFDGKIEILADSDAMIVRGFISIFVQLLNGRSPEEVLAFQPRFIEQTSIKKNVSTDRFHGLRSILKRIQDFAAEHV